MFNLKASRALLTLVAIFACGSGLAVGDPPGESQSARSQDPTSREISFAALGPSLRANPIIGYQLLSNISTLIKTLETSSAQPKILAGLSFTRQLPAIISTTPANNAEYAPPAPKKQEDSSYKWLLRSQKRNVLRDEDRGRVFVSDTRNHLNSRTHSRLGDVQAEITLSSSNQGELLNDNSLVSRSATEVKVAFPILNHSHTTIQGRIGGDSGAFTWATRANVTVLEIDKHSMDAGAILGSILFQNSLQTSEHSEANFRSDWIASVYARDYWELHPRYGLSYGLTYERWGYPSSSGFFSPQAAFITKIAEGFKLANEFVYGVNLPGRALRWSMPVFSESYTLSDQTEIVPERFLAFRATVEKQIGPRQALDIAYVLEKLTNPILQVPYRDFAPEDNLQPSYRYLLTNSSQMRSHGVRVGYRAKITEKLTGGVTYRVNRSKALTLSTTPMGLDPDAPADLRPWTGDSYIQTVAANVTLRLPKTASCISGDYRWDSSMPLRPDTMIDGFDDPTTQIEINLRQGIPFISTGDTVWEILLDIRNPITLGKEPIISFGREERIVVLVPHPRRITGGLTLRF